MPTPLNRDRLFSYAKEHRQEFEGLLRRFVETPTVSCDPAHAEDIKKGLSLTVETLEKLGAKATIYGTDKGNPLVQGVFRELLLVSRCSQL